MPEPVSNAERIAARSLRAVLEPLEPGAAIEDSPEYQAFKGALEYLLADLLVEAAHPFQDGFDGFDFAVARKITADDAEFIGHAILIDDQTWALVHLRIATVRDEDRIARAEIGLGEPGEGRGGLERIPFDSSKRTKRLHPVLDRIESVDWVYRASLDR